MLRYRVTPWRTSAARPVTRGLARPPLPAGSAPACPFVPVQISGISACLRRGAAALLLASLAGCHSVPAVPERLAAAEARAAAAGLHPRLLAPAPLPLQAFARLGCAGQDLSVYIEGDGYAWVSASRPSSNPTPVNPVALLLAAADPACNVVYLGRPGQYHADGVDPRYWLDARFAPEVVDSYVAALGRLREESGAPRLHLAGFSGGGAVAALVAARLAREGRVPVTLRTVAGNLDTAAWVKRLRLTPLSGSLNPADEAALLAGVPQLHFAGGRDRQVPPQVLEAYLARLPSRDCVQVVNLAEAAHAGPWEAAWTEALRSLPSCHGAAPAAVAR